MKTKIATPAPTGIEALVCQDIARRQQMGPQKYGTTVAANPLALQQWLQHLYEELLDAAVYTRRTIDEIERTGSHASAHATPAVAARKRPNPPRPALRHSYQGRLVSVNDLAEAAGCSWSCMQQRLRRHTPDVAVAMGASGERGVKRPEFTRAATEAAAAKAKRFDYKGQQLTARELAALAGCTAKQMHLRLRHCSAERAVAMGAADIRGKRRFDVPSDGTQARAAEPARKAATTPAPAADAEIIIPANVKRTVAPPIPERFTPTHAPQHFSGRIGRYDEDAGDTQMARAAR